MKPAISLAISIATIYAFMLSLQFLAQPFVWRNFPISEIFTGWVIVFRDRLIVAAVIAVAILSAVSVRTRHLQLRAAILAAGIVAGAVLGEIVVRSLYQGVIRVDEIAAHATRWSVIALALALTFYLWRRNSESEVHLQRESLRNASIDQQLSNTRLAVLRRQIEPHFLFNTLATVRRMQNTDPVTGSQMLGSFIDYLGRILPLLDHSEVRLRDEVDLITAYLGVIVVRMTGRLQVTIDVPEHLSMARVPPFALATLVENAVKHGITPATGQVQIIIRATEFSGLLELSVTDTGVGLNHGGSSGAGIGLSNVRSRLNTLYGANTVLKVEGITPRGVRATIRFPCRMNAT